MSPATALRSSKNCISVSSSAGSGMLLTNAILRLSSCRLKLSIDITGGELFLSAQRGGIRPPSISSDMRILPSPLPITNCSGSSRCALQRLIEVSNDIVDILDAHTKLNHPWPYTHSFHCFWPHFPVR